MATQRKMNKKTDKCDENCTGLDAKELKLEPKDKHLFRLAEKIDVHACTILLKNLKLPPTTWKNNQYIYKYDIVIGKFLALYQWKELKYNNYSNPSFQELSDALPADSDTHVLCQVIKEDETGNPTIAQQKIPEDGLLQELSKNLGNCAIHLGVELGLDMATIKETLKKQGNSTFDETLDVMRKWKLSSEDKSMHKLMKALKWADETGYKFLDSQFPMIYTSDEMKELLSKGTFLSYENCVYLGGACNVGKTTLARILIGEEIPRHWKSTDGLTIYFGKNGINLKTKEMVPLKQGSDGGVLSKVLRGKPEIAHKPGDDKEIAQKPGTTLSKNSEGVQPQDDDKDNIIKDNTLSTGAAPNPTPDTGNDDVNITSRQQSQENNIITTIQENIKEEIRKGTYKIEIAPSDLVDFGGQRSFDMTHQLFMRYKGTFVLMFNGQIDFSAPLNKYKQKETTEEGDSTEAILKHWVNSILSYCVDDEDILPRIMFCATHRDHYITEKNHEERRKKLIHGLVEMFKNHKLQQHIIYDDIFFINGMDENDHEINRLKSKLVEVAFQQKSWGKPMAMAFVPLDLHISELRLHNMNIISKEELITLNQRNEDLALTVEQIKYFLNVQHSLGKILYFDQHGLDNFIVVQPQSLVNILRSFITDKLFWPKDEKLRSILCTLTKTGNITKQDLLELWLQEKFHQHMPNDDFKEFIIQVLVHLDILVEPKCYKQEQGSKVQSYLVPCIVKRTLPKTDFYVKSADKMICLSYTLLKSPMPTALSFKLIGAALNVWPLKETKEGICLYHQAAILCIDESNDLHLLVEDDKVFVYLINKENKGLISPNIASAVQECLTLTMTQVLEFYHKSFGKSLSTSEVSKAFEIEVGEWCTSGGGCYKSVRELKEKTEWTCKNDKKHKYSLYWIFDKEQVECDKNCLGLDAEHLALQPDDKHLFRLAERIDVYACTSLFLNLRLSSTTWKDIQYMHGNDIKVAKFVALCKWKDLKYKKHSNPSFQELSDALAKDCHTHFLCQLFMEDVTIYGIANSALQEIPEDNVLQDLSQAVGNCAIHLGVELELKWENIEETLTKYPKSMYEQTFDVMKKWKISAEVKTIRMLMKAFQSVDGRGLKFFTDKWARECSQDHKNGAGEKISDNGDGNL